MLVKHSSNTILHHCRFNERSLAVPTVADLQSHKIVVATLSTSRAIFLSKLPRGHFTHIFIDEAAQVCVCVWVGGVCVCVGGWWVCVGVGVGSDVPRIF